MAYKLDDALKRRPRPLLEKRDADVVFQLYGDRSPRCDIDSIDSDTCYVLNCDDALSNAFFIDAHAASTPACMSCHADSLAVRISCNFLYARSRLARIAFNCWSNWARVSALAWSLLARSLSTSASHFFICDSIIAKYSSFLAMVTLL